jgi:hypothetical protein
MTTIEHKSIAVMRDPVTVGRFFIHKQDHFSTTDSSDVTNIRNRASNS